MSEHAAIDEDLHHPHTHAPNQAHHFDTMQQQFDAGKFGMWLFLVQEVLFFSGLFVAYAVFRVNHPEIFRWGHQFLDKGLGGFNTAVLIFSSLTAAWAVRCAQLNQRRGLIICLIITLVCAFIFLGVKYVEYTTKFSEGLFWAGRWEAPENVELRQIHLGGGHAADHPSGDAAGGHAATNGHAATATDGHGTSADKWDDPPEAAHHGGHPIQWPPPPHAGVFFSIYFGMTGLHAIHVIAGIVAISWLLKRAINGEFGSDYFGPVDYVALYWHLVDLVWIYLFPMLYLIE